MLFLFALLICFISPDLLSQEIQLIQQVNGLDSLEGESFRHAADSIFASFDTITDTNLKAFITNSIFDKTKLKDELAHIHSLIFAAKYSDRPKTKLYDEAFRLAKKHNNITDMCFVEYSRSNFYIAHKQYDSAMVHLLAYRDMTPKDENGEGYRNILNILGDIYYQAGLNDYAFEVYFDLYEHYKKDANWNFYRPYVMMNNMGQIAIKKGDFVKANSWFNKSLNIAEQYLLTPYRENTIAYTKIKVAEVALLTNNVEEAELLINEVAKTDKKKLYEDVIQELIFIKARVLLYKKKSEKALELARQLVPIKSNIFVEYRFVPEIYQFLSDAYYLEGIYDTSIYYLKEYQRITDSIRIENNFAQSMVLLANRDYEQAQVELLKSRQKINLLLIGFIFLVIILVVVALLYRKLYLSKLDLVRKTMKESIVNNHAKDDVKGNMKSLGLSTTEISHERELIVRLQKYMSDQKPYLNRKISIDELAKQLSTNRTYLSRAINHQLDTSFPNYINKYRIRESIILIIEGYALGHTMEALAKEVGFASSTVFITAFKKHTGIVPSFFVSNYKKLIKE